MKINFIQLDKPIDLNRHETILNIKSKPVFAKVLFSLRRNTDYFKILKDNFNDSKQDSIVILSPLEFELGSRQFSKSLQDKILNDFNHSIDLKSEVETAYAKLLDKIFDFMMINMDVSIAYDDDFSVENILKKIKLSVGGGDGGDFLGVVQNILKTLKNLTSDKLIVFADLSAYLSPLEYEFIIEQVRLDDQKILLIESNASLGKIPRYELDEDWTLFGEDGKIII